MAYPVQNTQVVELGLSRLISRYQGQPNMTAWVASYLKEVQALENAAWDVLSLRNIADGQGDQLNQIGKLVGQGREGLDDPTYRVAIGLRVLANRSKGRSADIIKIAKQVADLFTIDGNGVVDYEEAPVYSFSAGIWNQLHPEIVASLLNEARAETSRGVLVYSTWSPSFDDSWGSVYSPTAGQNGFGSVYDSNGGLLVSARDLK